MKLALHYAFGDYQYWKVFSIDLPQDVVPLPAGTAVRAIDSLQLATHPDAGMQSRADFDGPESQGYGLFVEGELVCVQWYWWGRRYYTERSGRSWLIPERTAKSVGLYTIPKCRGRGYAMLLKQHTAGLMYEKGFIRLYSRIWHSHKASIQVSIKAGWKPVGSYIEICPFGRRIELRIPL